MKFLKKLKEKLFSTTSRIGDGLEEIIENNGKEPRPLPLVESANKIDSVDTQKINGDLTLEKEGAEPKDIDKVSKRENGVFKKLLSNVDILKKSRRLDEKMLTELEDHLIASDLGVSTACLLIEGLRKQKFSKEINLQELKQLLKNRVR